jgi:hypothetical protein
MNPPACPPPPPPTNLQFFPFFPLVHWLLVLKHLNISYTIRLQMDLVKKYGQANIN